ncbi:MAG TPA: aminoacyl-tRNA hydrolase [Nitrospinota bacterium]|nr:aminoacyl-tRNA hydrolase [Nitrospinota bacterium]
MEIIVGLGNPGAQYEITRHNIGFLIIDELALKYKIALDKKGYYSIYGRGKIAEKDVMLVKPVTYMNLSGGAVHSLVKNCSSSLKDLLIIHDDIDIPLGNIRKKTKGGDAGHKGIRSIIQYLESGTFSRLRIGVGRPEKGEDASDYLLEPIFDKYLPIYTEIIKKSADEVTAIIKTKTRVEKETV